VYYAKQKKKKVLEKQELKDVLHFGRNLFSQVLKGVLHFG